MAENLFKRLFAIAPERVAAEKLYSALCDQSRQPAFYLEGGVADTIDGRFDLVVLNVFLVVRRLKDDRAATKAVSQALFDTMFENLDESLRELGVGDLSVGGKVKKMAEAFYGRAAAYEDGLASDDPSLLRETLQRNLFRGAEIGDEALELVYNYVLRQNESLKNQDLASLCQGDIVFEALGHELIKHKVKNAL